MPVNKNIDRQQGSIIIWMVVLIPIVYGIISFLHFHSQRRMVREDLQIAANAAALAGAKAFCSSIVCFNDALEIARATLALHSSYSLDNLDTFTLDPAPNDDCSSDPNTPIWRNPNGSNLVAKIERGWWVKEDPDDIDSDYVFESLECDWQNQNLGIPAFMAANAIKVTLSLELDSLISIGIGDIKDVATTASALAITGPVDEIPVAPFAIPACSLLDETGEFRPEEICYGDRYFTNSDRYFFGESKTIQPFAVTHTESLEINGVGPFQDADEYRGFFGYSDANEAQLDRRALFLNNEFGVRPSFFYGPCSEDINECNIRRQLNYSHDRDNTIYNNEYITHGGWSNYAYANIADHYGVVGWTDPASTTDEATIWEKLNNKDLDIAAIGSRFKILEAGLQDETKENILIDLIKNAESADLYNNIYLYGSQQYDVDVPYFALWEMDGIFGKITLSTNRQTGLFYDNLLAGDLSFYGDQIELLLRPDLPPALTDTDNDGNPDYIIAPTTTAPDISPSFPLAQNHFYNDARLRDHTDPAPVNDFPTFVRDQFSNGLCQSNRMELHCRTIFGSFVPAFDNPALCALNNPTDIPLGLNNLNQHFNPAELNELDQDFFVDYMGHSIELRAVPKTGMESSVFRVKVPVIADNSIYAESCESEGNFGEPPVLNYYDYIIIGFVTVNIFDVDIGSTSVNPPFVRQYSVNNAATYAAATPSPQINNYLDDNYVYSDSNYDSSILPTTAGLNVIDGSVSSWIPDMDQSSGPDDWSFKINGSFQDCNLVRARVECNTNFIASTHNSGYREAQLINQ